MKTVEQDETQGLQGHILRPVSGTIANRPFANEVPLSLSLSLHRHEFDLLSTWEFTSHPGFYRRVSSFNFPGPHGSCSWEARNGAGCSLKSLKRWLIKGCSRRRRYGHNKEPGMGSCEGNAMQNQHGVMKTSPKMRVKEKTPSPHSYQSVSYQSMRFGPRITKLCHRS